MKIHLEGNESDARIEILPLMDVIFCILTFFILAALQFTNQQGININLPKAKTGQPQVKQERMIVSVNLIGQTYVDNQPVTREQLLSELRSYIQRNPKGVVVLNAAKTASYNDVIQVLDLLRAVGGDRVALATLPASSSDPIQEAPATGTNSATPGITNPGWSLPGQENSGLSPTTPGGAIPGGTAPGGAVPQAPGGATLPGGTTLPGLPDGTTNLPSTPPPANPLPDQSNPSQP